MADRVALHYADENPDVVLGHSPAPDWPRAGLGPGASGKRYIEMDDAHITEAGALGVRTKADNVTAFKDFSFGAASR